MGNFARSYYEIDQLHPFDLTGVLVYEDVFTGIADNYELAGGCTVPYEVIDIVKGNDRTIRVYVKDRNLDIIDLTGATAYFVAQETPESPIVINLTTANISEGEIGAADEGEIFFYFVPATTTVLNIRQYVWYVVVTLSNGKQYTVVNGVMNLLRNTG